ncbi:unnamed protein product [Mytilus edulis]|uniref:Uncharacterized protein n=1 Tax=Mytilus edulis TaxID=6550 RepID=A0A8S3T7N9_MYTED|nr:unnamed protein product [Mytilus edulis]
MSNRAGQQYAVQTFDQQLYAVAQQVKWSMPDVFHSHVIRLGGFHGFSCFVATVGKLWASAGLSDLHVDSAIYASNTVDKMLVGKQFNRGVRGLTLAYEALMVLLFKAFFNWCRDENRMKTIQPNVWKVFLDCHSSFAVPSTPQSTEDIEEFFNVFEEHILPLFEEFRTHYCSISPTFAFGDMFLLAVEILLQNIRGEQDGLWLLHLKSVSAMLPSFFITNRTNYARWTPAYVLDMLKLPETIKSSFLSGEFAVTQKPGTFNGIWSDMAAEKNYH